MSSVEPEGAFVGEPWAYRRQYRKPPVVEAIARVHWDTPSQWDVTTPGLLYERLRAEYSAAPQLRNMMQAAFSQATPDAEVGSPGATMALRSGPPQILFTRPAENQRVMVGANDLSVHGLQPYEGWESLEQRLFEAIDLLDDFIPDSGFSQLGLRYINHVVIPQAAFQFIDYLTITFQLPVGFPETMIGFLDRAEVIYPDAPIRLAFTWGSIEAEPGTSAFVLDLDYGFDSPHPLSHSQAREALTDMKRRETLAFEGLLQDRLREMFDEVR